MTEHAVVSFDGHHLHVRDEGSASAPAVMLSHALGTSSSLWDALVPRLAERFRVIRYDTRGHGRSAAPQGPYSAAMLGKDALAVLDQLGAWSVRFIGLSQGGMTGLWLAAHHPERIERLVVANSAAYIPSKDMLSEMLRVAQQEGLEKISRATIERWLSPIYRARHPEGVEALVKGMQALSPAGFAGAVAMLRDVDLREDLGRIRCPTLVVSGVDDVHGAGAAAAIAGAIAGAQRAEIPDAAHLSPIENPEAFSEAVLEFLTPADR